jgi:hypothetical protein
VQEGCVTISSNDLDTPYWDVSLSGRIVDHAVPSLDAFSPVSTDTIDFGSHGVAMFTNQMLDVYNLDYNSLQAMLDVYDADFAGGDGRFSIVGGFTPQLVGPPVDFELAFDATGSPENTLYEAMLVLSTRDDPLVGGGANLDDLTIYLTAFVTDGTAVPDGSVTSLALGPALPNPFTDRTSLSMSMPFPADAVVQIYDISGRLVATPADGPLPAGVSEIVWEGTDAAGERVATGIYFCRAQVGEWSMSRKVVLLR